MSLAGLEKYRHQFDTVDGWMHGADLDMFERVLEYQLREDTFIQGDLLEIGCYRGKSAIAMGYGLRPFEVLHVCDLFGDEVPPEVSTEGMEAYEGLSLKGFKANYSWYHDKSPCIHACPSTNGLRQRIKGSSFRFIHVDGGHAYDVVTKDINLAVDVSCRGAVIALDDYRTAHTPGTAAAIWSAVAHGVLFPFALTEVKMYAATSRSDQLFWRTATEAFAQTIYGSHQLHGVDVLRVG